jgi:hypothetical protein
MFAGQSSARARRGAALFRGPRLDWSLALGAVGIGVLIYLMGDRTNWSGGFGFDGLFYGELAKNFPSAVFGDGQVIPPGFGPYTGPHISGLDSYYVFRFVPSALVWLGLKVLALSPTNGHVIGLFAGLNSLMFGLATWCWCRSAALLGLGDREKLLGATALLVNFAVLRTGAYLPVLTDQVALGLGALSFYLWLRGAVAGLVVCTLLACFTWPLHFVVGGLLLLFPPPPRVRGLFAREEEAPSRASWRPTPFGIAAGAVAGIAAIVALTLLQLDGRQSIEGTDQLPLFPLSAAITGLYVFAVFAYFLPGSGQQLWQLIRSIQPRRLALAVGVVAAARIAGSLLARHAGYPVVPILKEEFWWTTLDPGLFIVILVSYFGPLMLALLADLPRAALNSWRLGPGMAAVVAVGLLGALTTQPREVADVLPFLLLPGVLAVRRFFSLSNAVLLAFLAVSLVLSRIWLYIGPMSTDFAQLQHFPAQAYYMALGPWTPPSTYALQLGAVALIAIVGTVWVWARRSGGSETRT